MSILDIISEHPTLARDWDNRPKDERDIIISALELEDGENAQNALADLMEYRGPGRFEASGDRALAVAIEAIAANGFADDESGSVEYGLHGSRVGRFVLWTDSDGFVYADEYGTDEDAQEALNAEDARQNPSEED